MSNSIQNPENTPGTRAEDNVNSVSENQVGYGRPPAKNRFKKGQSGNPNGRPKGRKNIDTLVAEFVNQKIFIVVSGQRKSVTRMEALVYSIFQKALLRGDIRAFKELNSLLQSAQMDATPVGKHMLMVTRLVVPAENKEDWDKVLDGDPDADPVLKEEYQTKLAQGRAAAEAGPGSPRLFLKDRRNER